MDGILYEAKLLPSNYLSSIAYPTSLASLSYMGRQLSSMLLTGLEYSFGYRVFTAVIGLLTMSMFFFSGVGLGLGDYDVGAVLNALSLLS